MTLSGLLAVVRARLRALFRRDVVAGEIHEELAFHLKMREEGYVREGAPAATARTRAHQRFGNPAVWQDRGYDIRGGGVMETILQDLRYGARLLWRQPGFSVVAILTLALSIGMTTAIASVIDAAMLHPLAYPHPEELVDVLIQEPSDQPTPSLYGPSRMDVEAIRAATDVPLAVGMWRPARRIADGPEPERLNGLEVDEGYLDVMGAAPIRGRGIQTHDLAPGAPAVAVIGYAYWQRRFAGQDSAIGQRVPLDNDSVEVIGVLPKGYEPATSIVLPLRLAGRMATSRGMTAAWGRLRSAAAVERSQQQLTAILRRSPGLKPVAPNAGVQLRFLVERATRGYWTTANILLGAVGLILLIGCVNVAGLLLARGATRLHEFAIRASIGAGRGRLIRQLLTESVLLAMVGGTLGVLVAGWTLTTLVANIPLPVDANLTTVFNWRVLAFSGTVTLLTGIGFGLLPALRLSRVTVSHALARSTRRTGSALSRRGGQWLIGVEVALALVLVTGAGLMIRSFARLVSVDLGFDPGSFVTLQAQPVELQAAVFATYYDHLLQSIRALPDVEAAGAINHLPLMRGATLMGAKTDDGRSAGIVLRQVLPGYFEAIGLKPTSGRLPTTDDLSSGRGVAVVTERAAKTLFPTGSAVGRAIDLRGHRSEIVGIVPELKADGALPIHHYDEVEVFDLNLAALDNFSPNGQPASMVVVVRPRSNAHGLPERLRRLAQTAGPPAVVERVRPGTEWLGDTVATQRQRTVLLGLLGGLGLLLTLIGVFGMTAYTVTRRTREIGVRLAFGARPGQVVGTMMTDAIMPIVIGLGVGLAGSWFAMRLIATFLFQTTPTDPATFALSAAALAVATIAAVWIPARRAAHVDPVASLRVE